MEFIKPFRLSLFLTLCFFSFYASAECQFSFQVDKGRIYSEQDYADFVEIEIRGRLSRTQEKFDVTLLGNCDGSSRSVVINMETVALYIESINGVPLAEDVARYTDDNVVLDIENLSQAFESALKFGKLTKTEQQNVVKYFAFVVAESARFEDVENAVTTLLSKSCSYQWQDYKDMLRRWKTMSIFVNSQGLARGVQYFGGYRAFLIAPITSKDVTTYNTATQNGWKVVRYGYGNPRIIDKASPIDVGGATCQTN